MFRAILFLFAVLVAFQSHAETRIKDVAAVQGVRDNQLIGYGLVMGLQGTGDTLRNSQFTEQSLQSMLDRMGVNVRDINLRTRNVAAVIVTADLPPFVGAGSRIDVTVTSMGDATSLKGGTLMLTALQAATGRSMRSGRVPSSFPAFPHKVRPRR
jgi:flagellar P-ring protein precursor FlgI